MWSLFPQYLYKLKRAGEQDRICARKTRCTAESFRSMYEILPARDAESDDVNGTDAVCANYTVCSDGQEVHHF